ncbi:MAG: hypothetical protein ABIT05_12815 [Chitinophagaceae bacterium]
MKQLFAFIAVLLSAAALAQKEIKIEELNEHIGDSVTVCTKIYGGIYLDRSKGAPTFLNAGGSYPNAPLTIVIWDDARKLFKEQPEVFYKDKEVCVTGKVILYKEKPEIVVYDEKQITVK